MSDIQLFRLLSSTGAELPRRVAAVATSRHVPKPGSKPGSETRVRVHFWVAREAEAETSTSSVPDPPTLPETHTPAIATGVAGRLPATVGQRCAQRHRLRRANK